MNHKPNLFIIGAAKSGTTSLHEALSEHPDIFMTEPKEPGFFVPEIDYYRSDEEWYLGLFDGAQGNRYRGESSTHYTKIPIFEGVPNRIQAFVDEPPRFIYIMRDPLDRAISNYWHNVRKFQEHRGIGEALRDGVEYRAVSDYRSQLEPYFDLFGRDAVLLLTFERLKDRPHETLGEVFQWLGLPAAPGMSFGRKNVRPETFREVRGKGRLDRFARTPLWDTLSPLVPQWLKDMGKRAGYRTAKSIPEEVEEAGETFRPEMAARVRDLESFLGRRFPEWTVTLGTGAAGER